MDSNADLIAKHNRLKADTQTSWDDAAEASANWTRLRNAGKADTPEGQKALRLATRRNARYHENTRKVIRSGQRLDRLIPGWSES